jgi:AcrR family transcriptional regulator
MASGWVLAAESERERLLLATAELWREVGYEGLTAESIGARAGVKAEAFASIFADVGAAARAAIETPIAVMVSLVGEQFAPDRSEPESCMMGIVAILNLMAANPAYAFVVYVGRKQRGVPADVNGVAVTTGGFMVAMLERLRDSSSVTVQPVGAGLGALGAAEAVVRREVVAGRAERLLAVAPSVVYGAIVPFVGQDEAVRLARLAEARAEGLVR